MPVELLPVGTPFTMLAGVAYALPAVKTTVFTDAVATLTQSNTAAFTLNAAVTLTGGAAVVSGGYLKAAGNTLITLKRD